MPFASRYLEMKARIPGIKQLFQTRHYIQCAEECERLLVSTKYVEIHPVHKACLHFYLALCHDTMARDSNLKSRSLELSMAEKHYIAALKALTPPSESRKLENIQEFHSPTSSTSSDETDSVGRRPYAGSFDSQHSAASSESSYPDDDDFFADWESKRSSRADPSLLSPTFQDGSLSRKQSQRMRPSPIITNSRQSYYREQFVANLYAFTDMIESHLASIRELKAAILIPGHQYSFSRPRGSTVGSRPISRDSNIHGDAAGMEILRQHRKAMTFRPRFDPTSVRELCQEALAEL